MLAIDGVIPFTLQAVMARILQYPSNLTMLFRPNTTID